MWWFGGSHLFNFSIHCQFFERPKPKMLLEYMWSTSRHVKYAVISQGFSCFAVQCMCQSGQQVGGLGIRVDENQLLKATNRNEKVPHFRWRTTSWRLGTYHQHACMLYVVKTWRNFGDAWFWSLLLNLGQIFRRHGKLLERVHWNYSWCARRGAAELLLDSGSGFDIFATF